MRVVTVVTGVIATKFQENLPDSKLPSGSYYTAVEEDIQKQASGESLPKAMKVETYAEQVVSDLVSGATGKTWRGGFANVIRLASSTFPTFVTVSRLVV